MVDKHTKIAELGSWGRPGGSPCAVGGEQREAYRDAAVPNGGGGAG